MLTAFQGITLPRISKEVHTLEAGKNGTMEYWKNVEEDTCLRPPVADYGGPSKTGVRRQNKIRKDGKTKFCNTGIMEFWNNGEKKKTGDRS